MADSTSSELDVAVPAEVVGSTQSAGQSVDQGRARIFPCDRCGADLTYHIGQKEMKCEHCGYVKPIEFAPDADIAEQDFHAMLDRLAELRSSGQSDEQSTSEVTCEACGATVTFVGTLSSTECAYCGSPIQREHVHDSPFRVPVDGVLPFAISRDRAAANLKKWVRSRWFAPNDFRERLIEGQFNGVYIPYWTFDSLTLNRYSGQRGEHYWVTVGTGKNRRTVRHTRWWPAAGSFEQFFDDVLVLAGSGLPAERVLALEPWPLRDCVPFKQQLLAGFLARTYDVPLDAGFQQAKVLIDRAILNSVRADIGGDEQRVHNVQTQYGALTYKHLLLPVWLLAYRYRRKSYQVAINAATGEVQGDRPYSWVKITLAALAGAAAAAVVGLFFYLNG